MTVLEAAARIAELLGCLDRWDEAIDELESVDHLVDLNAVARALVMLDASARAALRVLEAGALA